MEIENEPITVGLILISWAFSSLKREGGNSWNVMSKAEAIKQVRTHLNNSSLAWY